MFFTCSWKSLNQDLLQENIKTRLKMRKPCIKLLWLSLVSNLKFSLYIQPEYVSVYLISYSSWRFFSWINEVLKCRFSRVISSLLYMFPFFVLKHSLCRHFEMKVFCLIAVPFILCARILIKWSLTLYNNMAIKQLLLWNTIHS